MTNELLTKYAELVVKVGINIQKGDKLMISFNENGLPLARAIVKSAYDNGASKVEMMFSDDEIKKLSYLYETKENLLDIPKWYADRANSVADKKMCYVAILSDNPELFEDIDSDLIGAVAKRRNELLKRYYDAATSNKIRWSLCAVPNESWAKKMFPSLPIDKAMDNLWEMILKTMRLDKEDSIKAWEEHINNLQNRSNYLTNKQFDSIKITNKLGTNLVVGMPKGYYFSGGNELSQDGIQFTANMPTEEVFSLPNKNDVNGIVYSSMPLIHNGKMVDEFYLKLENGKIVDYGAKKGYDTLKAIIESDEGSHYLGEIALVQFDSPIRNLNTLFYETLFDENASCHLAIGEAYPMVKGAEELNESEQDNLGINKSSKHVDFMIGTSDLEVIGIKGNEETLIMHNGNFII